MGMEGSKSSSSISGFSSSSSSRSRRRRHRYTLIASSNTEAGHRVAPEADGIHKEELAVCLASISLMALTGEGTNLPKRSSSTSSYVNDSRKRSSTASSSTSAAAAVSINSDKTKLHQKLRMRRHQSVEDEHTLAESFDKHIQLLDYLEREEDDSPDWASMRSWLVWCIHNKLGDIETNSTTADEPKEVEGTPKSYHEKTAYNFMNNAVHHLQRQRAVHERSRIVSSSNVLSRQETSIDGGMICSGQSSFESYGSTGTGP